MTDKQRFVLVLAAILTVGAVMVALAATDNESLLADALSGAVFIAVAWAPFWAIAAIARSK